MIKAISGNVFIKPDPKEDEVGVIGISAGATTRASYGDIIAIDGKCEFAKVGDRVHIPHYGVVDMEIDGEEYAVCKTNRLFLVNQKAVNDYVKVRKCSNDHVRDEDGEIALYMTENHLENTNWCEVIEWPNNEKYHGLFCVLPENDDRLARIGRSKDFACHTDLIDFLTEA